MGWRDELLKQLAAATPGGYSAKGEAASEPTALAGLAMLAAGDQDAAGRAAGWLVERQGKNGAVGVTLSQATPYWPTSLAILLWIATGDARYQPSIERAVTWALQEKGETHEQRTYVGHDTTLVGWSWAADTHSWVEPTSMFVLALKAVGQSQHPRTREAVRLLIDRLLPDGGCNYGNTIVLGQELLPHVQPTGILMMAIADERSTDPRIERSLDFLERELSQDTTTASLSYGLLGLTAHSRSPKDRFDWLEAKSENAVAHDANYYKLALISLAANEAYPFGRQH